VEVSGRLPGKLRPGARPPPCPRHRPTAPARALLRGVPAEHIFHEQTHTCDSVAVTRWDSSKLWVSPQTLREHFLEMHVSHVLWVPRVASTCPAPNCHHRAQHSFYRAIFTNSSLDTNSLPSSAPFAGTTQGRISKYTFQSVVICETSLAKIY